MTDYDVIVIGSGLGGLTSASHLATLGYKVAVFEQHYLIGGYATNFKRKGYNFDISLHGIGGLQPGGNVHRILQACQILDKITPLKNQLAYQVKIDQELVEIPNDVEAYQQLLLNRFPSEKRGIEKLFKAIKRFENGFSRFILKKDHVWHPDVMLFMNWSGKTTEQVVRQYVNQDEFIKFFTALWPYYGLPPKELSAIYFFIPWVSYHHHGKYYIKGGGGELSKAFTEVIKENGGAIYPKSFVKEIAYNGERVTAITLSNNQTYTANWIISSANPLTLSELLPAEIKLTQADEKLHASIIGCTLTQLYLGLDCHPSKLSIPEDEVFYFGEDSHEADYQNALNQKFETCGFLLTNYNTMDSELNDPDKGVLTVTFLDDYEKWPDERTAYQTHKEIIVEKIMQRLEKEFPGMIKHTVIKELGTPKTMERYTKNPKGAVYGYAQTKHQAGRYRLKSKTEIPNLMMANAWVNPGGGYEGVISSGMMVARYIHQKESKKR